MKKDKSTSVLFFRSPFFLFLILPVFLSILIHFGLLTYAGLTPWHFGHKERQQINSVLIDIKQKVTEPPPESAGAPRKRPPPKKRPPEAQPKVLQSNPVAVSEKINAPAILAGTEGADWLKVDPSWGTGEMLHSGPQGPTQTFSEYLQALRAAGLDLVIVLDSTCSMDVIINRIKPKVENLALALRRLVPSCRIGIVTYRDHGDDYLTKKLPLTYGIAAVKDFIKRIEAKGGGDVPEAVDEGLRVAIQEMKWNPKSKSFILLIGDAPPHDADIPRTIAMAAAFRKQRRGTISILDVTSHHVYQSTDQKQESSRFVKDVQLEEGSGERLREDVDKAFIEIAEAGGGEAGRLIDEEKIVKNMLLYIVGTQWRAYLTEIMKNL